MGLFGSKKTSNPGPPPVRRDHVRKLLKLGMDWYEDAATPPLIRREVE